MPSPPCLQLLPSIQFESARNAYAIWRRFTLAKRLACKRLQRSFRNWKYSLRHHRQIVWRNEIRAAVHHNYSSFDRTWTLWHKQLAGKRAVKYDWNLAVAYGKNCFF
jgi:hypothetical protein